MSKTSKLFGKALWSKKKKPQIPEMYDFAQHGLLGNSSSVYIEDLLVMVDETPEESDAKKKRKEEVKNLKPITPKNLYNLNTLNETTMAINCGSAYIKSQVALLKKKADLMLKNDAPVRYGKQEVLSLAERLENRKQLKAHETFYNEFPYTTSEKIETVVKSYSNLRVKRAEEFVPDFPADAIDVMERYNKHCLEICGKKAVFYIIADKKDFGEINRKRDPILLAQSPFGLVWQVLGAWDEEMIYLGEL